MTARTVPVPLVSQLIRVLAVAIVLAIICYFSLLTAPPASPTTQPFWDKQLHFAAYAGLTLALAYATVHHRNRPLVRAALVVGGAIIVGALIELVQGITPDRYFAWSDLLANCLGIVLASGWFLIERRVHFVRIRRLRSE